MATTRDSDREMRDEGSLVPNYAGPDGGGIPVRRPTSLREGPAVKESPYILPRRFQKPSVPGGAWRPYNNLGSSPGSRSSPNNRFNQRFGDGKVTGQRHSGSKSNFGSHRPSAGNGIQFSSTSTRRKAQQSTIIVDLEDEDGREAKSPKRRSPKTPKENSFGFGPGAKEVHVEIVRSPKRKSSSELENGYLNGRPNGKSRKIDHALSEAIDDRITLPSGHIFDSATLPRNSLGVVETIESPYFEDKEISRQRRQLEHSRRSSELMELDDTPTSHQQSPPSAIRAAAGSQLEDDIDDLDICDAARFPPVSGRVSSHFVTPSKTRRAINEESPVNTRSSSDIPHTNFILSHSPKRSPRKSASVDIGHHDKKARVRSFHNGQFTFKDGATPAGLIWNSSMKQFQLEVKDKVEPAASFAADSLPGMRYGAPSTKLILGRGTKPSTLIDFNDDASLSHFVDSVRRHYLLPSDQTMPSDFDGVDTDYNQGLTALTTTHEDQDLERMATNFKVKRSARMQAQDGSVPPKQEHESLPQTRRRSNVRDSNIRDFSFHDVKEAQTSVTRANEPPPQRLPPTDSLRRSTRETKYRESFALSDPPDLAAIQEPPKAKRDFGEDWRVSLTWPRKGPRRATVDFSDLPRLEEGEFLNDNLIAFYLRYLEEQVQATKPEILKKVYLFNTFFYERLSSKNTTSSGKKNINYDAVKKWTSKIDLFNYEYLVIPINESFHWYVAIICNHARLLKKEPEVISLDTQDEAASHMDEAPAPQTENKLDEIDVIPSSYGDLPKDRPLVEPMPSSPTIEPELGSKEDIAKATVLSLAEEAKTKDARRKARRKSAPPPRQYDADLPYVIILDSLGATHSNTARNLKDYLLCEAEERHGTEIDRSEIQGMTAKGLATQRNFSDCGIFMLAYIQAFLENPRKFTTKVLDRSMNEHQDWKHLNPGDKREEILALILSLHKAQEDELLDEAVKRDDERKKKEAAAAASDAAAPATATATSTASVDEVTIEE